MRAVLCGLVLASSAFANGAIQGTVTYERALPKGTLQDRSSDPACGVKQVGDETLLVGPRKGLQNVLVRLEDAPPVAPGPLAPVSVFQRGCSYEPRVQGAVEGQKLLIRNDDPTLHNVHAYRDTRSLFNIAQPPGPRVVEKSVAPGTEVMRLKCDVHPWMAGYVIFGKSSYFAVTRPDGSFELKDVPPGSYTLTTWHEALPRRSLGVVVLEGKAVHVHIELSQVPAPAAGDKKG